MVHGVGWDYPHEGYDPDLPGYRLAGGIGTIALSSSDVPGEFILEIRTTIAHRPNLEGVSLRWADTLMQITPSLEDAEIIRQQEGLAGHGERATVEQTYFEFDWTADIVRIRFLPPALRLIPQGCTLSWVDWYRR
jgi:hypothetical protein